MNISAPFVRRPVATLLIMVAITVFGVLAYVRLPVSALPNVDFPTINVQAALSGASPETMAASVATPLEREFSAIDGLTSMSSSSAVGSTQLTLQFDADRDLDAAAQDVQAAISRAQRRLPSEMTTPPSYRKVNPAEQPILILVLKSATQPLYVINEWGETRLAQKISTVRGVAQVQVFGAQKYAVRIQLDPDELSGRGIGIDEVAAAVRGANVNLPTGTLWGSSRAYTIEANGQLSDADAFRSVVVAYRSGTPVTLGQLGRVSDGVENDKTAAWVGEERAIVLAVQKQPGANTVEIARNIQRLLPSFRQDLPASVGLDVLFDRSESVKSSVDDVQYTLVATLVLVVLVIFLFLRRVTATLIPSIAMPLAIVGTFAVMYLLGYSLDNLSLMALTLCVGFVVDDAIVMLENVVRHRELGKTPLQAALDGSAEISFTIVSMTLSLVAVFLPFLFMGGILGSLFEEFAVTIAVAILLSGVVSLTLTPMLAGRLIRGEHAATQRPLYQLIERGFERIRESYDRALRVVLRHRLKTLLMSLGVLAATLFLFTRIPKGFLPTEDTGQLIGTTEAVEGVSYDSLVALQKQVAGIVERDPAVDSFMSSVGPRGTIGAANQGSLFIRLKDRSERPPINQVVARLRNKLSAVPGMRVFLQVPPPIRIGGRLTKSEYQMTLEGTDPQELYRSAPLVASEMAKVPGVRDVTTDMQLKNPQLNVNIDRERAAALGLTVEQIEDALYSAYGARQISSIYAPNNTYAVILELMPELQRDPTKLDELFVRAAGDRLIPLRSVASVNRSVGPLTVNHSGQLAAVTVSFSLDPGVGLSDAVTGVEAAARRVLPVTVTTRFQGAAEAFQASLSGLGMLLVISIFVIYLVLGILYESWAHPLTILSALPFAGFGALLTLWIFSIDLDVYAFVGVILLVGLVKKNGIMMVDFAVEAQKDRQKSASEAIHEACIVRFRPIMMTTMAALLGTLPLALGLGAGAETRRPLGLAVVGGLLFSQFLTLFVTPVFYVYMDRVAHTHLFRRKPALTTSDAASHPIAQRGS